jgi:hypothetical protein
VINERLPLEFLAMIEIILSVSALLVILLLWWIRKKKSVAVRPNVATSQAKSDTKTPAIVQSETKPEEKIIAAAEPVVQSVAEKPVSEPIATPQTVSSTIAPQQTPVSHPVACSVTAACHKNLPQDATLRRHYLTHVRAMISTLNAPRPTDSTLSRHYDSHIADELERCLNDKQAMQQLLDNYQQHKHIVLPVCSAPVATAEPETIVAELVAITEKPVVAKNEVAEKTTGHSLPEDSMLRRHYLSQLYAQIAADLPSRPTDSTLRRHYDSLLENLVKQQLG